MAARKVMERENVLAISKVDDLFNPILPTGQKLWEDFIPQLILHNRKKFTLHTSTSWAAVLPANKSKEAKKAIDIFKKRISSIVQIRHDWIHNCGRPRQAINNLTRLQALSAMRDIQTFIDELDQHIELHRLA
jgi:hypothetical protein